MAINRVKLNYRPATSNTPPIGKIIISENHMEILDRAIIQKVKQNQIEHIMAMETALI